MWLDFETVPPYGVCSSQAHVCELNQRSIIAYTFSYRACSQFDMTRRWWIQVLAERLCLKPLSLPVRCFYSILVIKERSGLVQNPHFPLSVALETSSRATANTG